MRQFEVEEPSGEDGGNSPYSVFMLHVIMEHQITALVSSRFSHGAQDKMPNSVDIVIAEDHDLVRRAVRRLLDAIDDFRILAVAADGEEAVRLVKRYEPDVAVLDVDMPKLNGIEAAEQMQQLSSPPKVVVLTLYAERDLVFRAFEAGCAAYVVKKAVSKELIDAIRHALDGGFFLSEELHHLWSEVEERLGI